MIELKAQLETISLELEQKNDILYKVVVESKEVQSLLIKFSNLYGYILLDAISCRDDIEDGVFTLTYCMQTEKKDHIVMVQTSIARENATMDSMHELWSQAEIIEREIHEMFGVDFPGHPSLIEMNLEYWDAMPPMRRDFDTLAYVNESDPFRGQRNDNIDVKAESKRVRAEKKAAKLKADEEAAAKAAAEAPKAEEGEKND